MIRRFVFYNNILGDNISMVPTKYCVLGYYDGLETEKYDTLEEARNESGDYTKQTQSNSKNNEIFETYELMGFRNSTDDTFWQNADKLYIFLSCIRFKQRSKAIDDIIKEFEGNNVVCYWTLDSSDLIVCYRSNSLKNGIETIKNYDKIVEKLDNNNGVYISFSSLLIEQDILEQIYEEEKKPNSHGKKITISREKLSVLLRMNVKNLEKLVDFQKEIQMQLSSATLEMFSLLGNTDTVFLLRQVDSIQFLCQFSKQGCLVHSHPEYKEAVYNVQSEILI